MTGVTAVNPVEANGVWVLLGFLYYCFLVVAGWILYRRGSETQARLWLSAGAKMNLAVLSSWAVTVFHYIDFPTPWVMVLVLIVLAMFILFEADTPSWRSEALLLSKPGAVGYKSKIRKRAIIIFVLSSALVNACLLAMATHPVIPPPLISLLLAITAVGIFFHYLQKWTRAPQSKDG